MERNRQMGGNVSWLGPASPPSSPPNTYFYSDISCHGRVKLSGCPVMESWLLLIRSVQSAWIQIVIINSASGGCAGAAVLAEKNKASCGTWKTFSHAVPSQISKTCWLVPLAASHHLPLGRRLARPSLRPSRGPCIAEPSLSWTAFPGIWIVTSMMW